MQAFQRLSQKWTPVPHAYVSLPIEVRTKVRVGLKSALTRYGDNGHTRSGISGAPQGHHRYQIKDNKVQGLDQTGQI